MGQPWGLSGPQFLGIYAAAIVAVIIIVLLFRRAMRRVPGASPARELSPYEVGYLSGGPRRAAEVIIAELAGTGALRVDSRGRLSEAGAGLRSGPFAGSVDRAWPDGMPPGGVRTARVRDRLSLVHFSDTSRKSYKHDPLGRGDVPVAGLASVMKEIGYTELPMLEIISHNPDADIADSCRRLQQAGFAGHA